MSNDSGIRRKHKQRTVLHKKHSVFPGITLSSEVKAEGTSIRSINRATPNKINEAARYADSDPAWAEFNEIHRKFNSSNVSTATLEGPYAIAYQALVKAGKAQQLKRKYRTR